MNDLNTPLQQLVALIKQAFDFDSLEQLVRYKMGADMYKEWVAPKQPFNDLVFQLLTRLQKDGLLGVFLDCVKGARAQHQETLQALRDQLTSVSLSTSAEKTAAIKSSFDGVADNLQLPPVLELMKQSHGVLTTLTAKIELLHAYKGLHDSLHSAKFSLTLLEDACNKMAADPLLSSGLLNMVTTYEGLMANMLGNIQKIPVAPVNLCQAERAWFDDFTSAIAMTRCAAEEGDHMAARPGIQSLARILGQEPSRIDKLLNNTAGEIDLAALKSVFIAAAQLPELASQAAVLEQGQIATEQLLRQVKAQVSQHGDWQKIDRTLAMTQDVIERLKPSAPWDFDALWKALRESVLKLADVESQSPWAKKATALIERVESARAANDWQRLQTDYTSFHQETSVQFFVVDTRLKRLATDVNQIGAPLRALLEKL